MTTAPNDHTLSDRDEALLDFEATWWQAERPKDDEIRTRFGISTPRYYQQLNSLIDQPEALAYAPLLVKRLRRMREQRQHARSASRLAPLR
ncbi:MAG: DUF3263 domain-containing protein [Propionibacteriaceae bacterium]|nr:DUF3263 domain-containing protein [Propionibacteriaceae bacterium]